MQRFDALIVGGGPAGSSCAWQLQRAGLHTLIIDKASFPRDKVCAGWVPPEVFADLQIDPPAYAPGRVLQPVQRFLTGLLGGKMITTDYATTVSYGIRRCEFDDFLLRRSGAELALGTKLTDLQRRNDLWCINDRYTAPLLIGAGGHFCPVGHHLNPKGDQNEAIVTAQEVEFSLTAAQQSHCRIAPGRPELYFLPELDGYGWCFRKGDYLNIGLGRIDGKGLGQQVDQFRQMLIDNGRIPANVPTRFHGHAYRLYGDTTRRRIVDDGVLLIGDAAGLASPRSGEGIRPAVESGLLAATTVLSMQGDYRRERLYAYSHRLEQRLGRRHHGARGIGAGLPKRLTRAAGTRILGNAWLTRHLLLDTWFLHRQQRPLAAHLST